jgi:putative hemolysin
MYSLLQNFRVSPEFETIPTAAYACPNEPQAARAQIFACNGTQEATAHERTSPVASQVKVPKLLKTYLAIGARIAAPPAFDREFRTIDFLTLLDLEMLSPAARNRFMAPLAP